MRKVIPKNVPNGFLARNARVCGYDGVCRVPAVGRGEGHSACASSTEMGESERARRLDRQSSVSDTNDGRRRIGKGGAARGRVGGLRGVEHSTFLVGAGASELARHDVARQTGDF